MLCENVFYLFSVTAMFKWHVYLESFSHKDER